MEIVAKITILIASTGLVVGCASNTYRIQSSPSAADVDLVYKSGARKNLGKTPVTLSASEANPNHEPIEIEIRKDGYEKQSIFVPESYFAKNIDTNVNLQTMASAGNAQKGEASLNEVASAVAEIQKDIQVKNYDIAMAKLNGMIAQYPSVATFYSLTGNVHYLEKRPEKALVSYKRALALNPGSVELQRIIEKLESVSGGGSR